MTEKQAPVPYRCPVCEGRGNVPVNFYSRATIGTSADPIPCKACGSKGFIWSHPPESLMVICEGCGGAHQKGWRCPHCGDP